MTEVVFWILVSFFSAVGVVEVVSCLKRLALGKKMPPLLLLVPQKDDAQGIEAQVRYLLSEATFDSRVVVVDMGLSEQGYTVCKRLQEETPTWFVSREDVGELLGSI